jgi:hypothetical protein
VYEVLYHVLPSGDTSYAEGGVTVIFPEVGSKYAPETVTVCGADGDPVTTPPNTSDVGVAVTIGGGLVMVIV